MPVTTNGKAFEITTRFGKIYHKLRYGHTVHPCGINSVFYPQRGWMIHQGICDHDGNHVCGCGFSWRPEYRGGNETRSRS